MIKKAETRVCQKPNDVTQMIRTVGNGNRKDPPPFRLQIFKGMKNIIIHRDLADFVLDDPIALAFKDWLEDTCCPEVCGCKL